MNQILVKKLQKYVKENSVNQLKNIKPNSLMEYLGLERSEFIQFVNKLNEERLLNYKYNINCSSCSSQMTIYESQLVNNDTVCNLCGEESFDIETIREGRVLYCLDKNEILDFYEEFKGFTSESLIIMQKQQDYEKAKVIDITERKKSMKIFIGSSKEAEKDMERIARLLENLKHTPVTWQDNDVFIAGEYTLESLIETAENVDAAIFVFRADDKTWYREKEFDTVRDNVILEYGLFSGKLGRKNTTFAVIGEPKIATDLYGINYLHLEDGDFNLKDKIDKWAKRIDKKK